MNKKSGYVHNFDEIDDDVSVSKGQAVAGCPIGILVLDLWYPYIPGNVANASTYGYPVRFKVLKGTTIPQILGHDHSLLDLVIEGGKIGTGVGEIGRGGVKGNGDKGSAGDTRGDVGGKGAAGVGVRGVDGVGANKGGVGSTGVGVEGRGFIGVAGIGDIGNTVVMGVAGIGDIGGV